MWKETKRFAIRLWVKDKKSQEIIELKKTVDLEVSWERKWGWVKEKVDFWKGDKVYWILVEIELVKYLFESRDTIAKSNFLSFSPDDYEIYIGYMGEPNNSPEKDRERQGEGVILIDQWRGGRITTILLVIVVIFVLWWMLKKMITKYILI